MKIKENLFGINSAIYGLSEKQVETFKERVFELSRYVQMPYSRLADSNNIFFDDGSKRSAVCIGEIRGSPNNNLYDIILDRRVPKISEGISILCSRIETIAKESKGTR